jgi:hypothetical protein
VKQAQISAFVPTHTDLPEIRVYHQKGEDVEGFLVADCNFKRACIKAVGDVNAIHYVMKMNT